MKKFNGLWLSLTLSLLVSCNLTTRTYIVPGSLPVLSTTKITTISQNSAIGGGVITKNGLNSTDYCGVCWSTHSNPTLEDYETTLLPETGPYTCYITGLTGSTTYFVRAFATTYDGTGYGDECQFTTEEATPTITDVDGNVYHTVQIGTQLWMAENLKTTKYKDGTHIPMIRDWVSTPGYFWMIEDSIAYIDYKNTYGLLYNWYTVNTGKLAPTGWHVPTDNEWRILSEFLGGDDVSAGKLKSMVYWRTPNTGATNSTGFSGLPGGCFSGDVYNKGYCGFWWSATEDVYPHSDFVWIRQLDYDNSTFVSNHDYSRAMKDFGFSVRCVKD